MAEPYRVQLEQAVTAALEGATVPGPPEEAGFASPGVVVVTANTRAARNLLRACDRRRLASQSPQQAWQTPAVLPLDAWINELWRTAQVCGLLDLTLLGQAQQKALWEHILEAAPPAAPGGRQLAPLAAEAWELAHAYDVPLRSPQFRGAAETQSFSSWAAAYGDHLAARKWADRARVLDLLLPRLPALKDFLPKRMVFVGFDRFTPQQRRLQEALASQAVELTVVGVEPGAETSGEIRSVKLADRSAELHTAAAWGRARLENDPAVRVGVVVAGLSGIQEQVAQAFSAILHPEQYFTIGDISQPAFDISLGPPLADYPIIHSALIFLRLLSGPMAREEFSAWLRSPYFGACGDQANARAVLDRSLAEALRPSVSLDSILQAAGKLRASQPAAELVRQLRPARELTRRSQAMGPSLWLQEMSKALGAAGWPGEGSGLRLSSNEYQAREAWDDLLAEVGGVELVEPRLELAQVVARVVEAAAAKIFKPQNQSAPVQVMGELEAAGSAFDALWIAGWSDGNWPRRHSPNPLIPIALQREHGLPHHSAEAELSFARSVTARLLQSAPEVVVSWPAAEEDRELRPSALIRSIVTANPGPPANAFAFAGVAEAQTLRLSWPKGLPQLFPATILESQTDDRAPAVAADELRSHGVHILERQANCPFRAFVEVRLLAPEPQAQEMGLAPTERGKLVETALQLAWEQLRDKFTLENCGEGRLREIIQAAVDGAFRKLEFEPADDWEERYLGIERERLKALLREWLEFERSREHFEVVDHQREIPLKLAGLRLRVRPDRLDRLRDGSLVILDYKSGKQSLGPSQWRTPRPGKPQLPSYAVALAEQSPAPAIGGVAFALVRRGKCGMAGISERPEILGKKSLRGDGLKESLVSWRPELESLARDFLGGGARTDPKRASTCDDTYCSLHALCRVAEIAFPAEPTEDHDDAAE